MMKCKRQLKITTEMLGRYLGLEPNEHITHVEFNGQHDIVRIVFYTEGGDKLYAVSEGMNIPEMSIEEFNRRTKR